ncbi:MAG: mechanosensitive ion channel domain-containing protein [Planctomycetota bacterium]|nr:mechanosensitive ion channel domain-containing protein [Planctomycetota bacterium]
MTRHRSTILLLTVLWALGWVPDGLEAAPQSPVQSVENSEAQTPTDTKEKDDDKALPEGAENTDAFSSPGQTLSTFLVAMADSPADLTTAYLCLDLPKGTYSKESTRQRAIDLQQILLHIGYDLDKNPGVPMIWDKPIDQFSLLPAPPGSSTVIQVRSGQVMEVTKGTVVLELRRGLDGRWQFSADTVSDANDQLLREADRSLLQTYPELFETARETMSLRNWLLKVSPPWLWQEFLFIAYIQWIGLAVILVIGLVVNLLVRFILGVLLRKWITRTLVHVAQGDQTASFDIRRSVRAFGLLGSILVWRWLVTLLVLPIAVFNFTSIALNLLAVLAAINASFKLTDLLGDVISLRAANTHNKLDDIVVPLVRKTLKFVILSLGFFYLASAVHYEITPLIAGIGTGGLGFAFAAQNSIENFFGSITVILDRPFQVGDWVVIDGVEGNVEQVGLRSTRVRTFYKSEMTIPNSILIKTTVDNYGRRQFRRWNTKLSLLYETTPEQVDAFCEGARELVRNHPMMRRDSYQVYLNEFGESGIDILVYVFWSAPDWATELRERHRFMLDLMRLAEALGVDFAYPTQTVYLAKSPGVRSVPEHLSPGQQQPSNEAAGREAARRIIESAEWRENRPTPYRYRSASESLQLDHGGEEADREEPRPGSENRGSAGEGGSGGGE